MTVTLARFRYDVVAGRRLPDFLSLLNKTSAKLAEFDVVLIHHGTSDHAMTAETFDEIMGYLKSVPRYAAMILFSPLRRRRTKGVACRCKNDFLRRVIIVNIYHGGDPNWDPMNVEYAAGVLRWKNAELLDWHAYAELRTELLSDGTHLKGGNGDHVFAGVLADCVLSRKCV